MLREDADRFVATVAAVAEREGREPAEVAREALEHALARLTEPGELGGGLKELPFHVDWLDSEGRVIARDSVPEPRPTGFGPDAGEAQA